ncbi:hypothetical protein ACLKMH_05630 [Psychromonas sp. KJ10-10]|uniref:hypothetical protein n=1 Tax=Psychromonas sp. KJ10-10 TaxID=3391823 RepID=UPI0039B481C7
MLMILCVDSDPQRLSQIKQDLILLNNNMDILEATTLQKALQLIVQNSDEIAIVLASQYLSDGDALTLLDTLNANLLEKLFTPITPVSHN